MFGFSLGKLLVLVAVVLAVWYGFKYLGRQSYLRESRAAARDRLDRRPGDGRAEGPRSGGRRRNRRGAAPADDAAAAGTDLTLCATCKAYVPARGARPCGRPDCPQT